MEKESKPFNAASEEVYRSILEYLLLGKSKIVATLDPEYIEATHGKVLSTHAKDMRKNIIVNIKQKDDNTCGVDIKFSFSKSNMDLCLEMLALFIEYFVMWLVSPFIGFHVFVLTMPLIFAMLVYYIQIRKQAFLSDLWHFLDVRLLPLDQLVKGKDFFQGFHHWILTKSKLNCLCLKIIGHYAISTGRIALERKKITMNLK